MQYNQRRRASRTRRWFLGSLGIAVAGVGAGAGSGAAVGAPADNPDEFALEQGDTCVPVVPLSSDVPIAERYGWAEEGADFSSTGLVDLQRPDTSILFLYDGPNGLSLVVVHDKYGDGTNGGSATFAFAGLPTDGEWVVQDDLYDGDSNYDQWTRDGDEATVDWTWSESRTDGGAFRGMETDSDLELRIEPSFNAAATLYGEHYDGEITAWEVLSGPARELTRTSLALDEPIVLRRGSCSTDETSEDDDDSEDKEDSEDSKDRTDDEEDAYDDDDDDDGDEYEDESEDDDDDDDDERGKGKGHERGNGNGHEKGKGKGHERGKGKGHERHGDDRDDEDDHPGNGKGKP